MKTGIELIAIERQEQIEKHGYDAEKDKSKNSKCQLTEVALYCLTIDNYMEEEKDMLTPEEWGEDVFLKIISNPYKERLIIAGALIAAEIDRLQS